MEQQAPWANDPVVGQPPAATPAPPRLVQISPPTSTVPQGYRPTNGGLAPIPGGPADQAHQAPSGYRYKADGSLEAIPGGPADPDRITRGPSGNAQLTGPDYVASIADPQHRAQVQAMLDGRIPYPTGRALTDAHWSQVAADAIQADPNFDAGNSRTRVATRQDFTSGQSSRNITAINTAIGHLASLQQAGDALDNGNWQFINSIRNTYREASGDPRLTAFNERRQAVVDELEKAFRGSSGTEAGISAWRESINAAQSPAQLHEAIRSGIDLLNSRLSALGDTYNRGLSRSEDPMTFLSPHSRELLAHLGQAPPTSSGSGDGIPGDGPSGGDGGPAVVVGEGINPPAGQVMIGYAPNGDGTWHVIYGARGTRLEPGWAPPDQAPPGRVVEADPNALSLDINFGRNSGGGRTLFTPAESGRSALSQVAANTIGSLDRYHGLQQFHAATAGMSPEAIASQLGITRSQAEALDAEYQDAARARGSAADLDRIAGREGYIDRITHGMTLGLDDEGAGVANMILHPTTPFQSFRQGHDAQRIRLDEARQDTGALGTIAEAGGSMLTLGPGFEAGGANGIRLGSNSGDIAAFGAARRALASGATREEALTAARAAAVRRMVNEGAAVSGFQAGADSNGSMSDRVAHAALATAMAYGGGRLAGRFLGGAAPVAQRAAGDAEQVEAAQAASELGIDLPRFIAGSERSQRAGNRLEQTTGGGPVIASARRDVVDQSAEARDTIAASVGNSAEPASAGDIARDAARTWRGASGAQGRSLYTQAQTAAGDTTVTPQATMQTLAQLIREERQVPGGTEALPIIQRYADAFDAGGQITIDGARKMRTTLRQRLGETMTPGNADRITNQIMGAVGQDIETSLRAAGREGAIPAYQAADRFWAQRMDTIRDVMEPYVGRNGDNWGADVVRAMQNDARGNGERLGAFLNTIPEDAANTVRATLISRLGQATDGRQNAAGDAFSLDTFLTNWNQIRGSRDTIFPPDAVRSLNQLAIVANRVKGAASTANRFNTGSIISGLFTTSPTAAGITAAFMSGDVKLAAAGILGSMAIALRQNASARLLASPAFARRLATTPMNPQAATAFWSRPWVAQLARSEPAIGADLLGFQDAFLHTVRGAQTGGSSQSQNR